MQAQSDDGAAARRDERALRRQLLRYAVRFNDAFWRFWDDAVTPGLPPRPVVADVGQGPGLFLRDLSARLPDAALHGLDANEAMIESAAALDYAGPVPSLRLMDAEAQPLPFADGEIGLLTMTAALHMFVDPFAFLRGQAARVIGADGRLLLYDWVRVPMRDYLALRMVEPGEPEATRHQRALEQFRAHNKYTLDDWRWVIAESGLRVERRRRRRTPTPTRGSCGRGREERLRRACAPMDSCLRRNATLPAGADWRETLIPRMDPGR